jgi:hypothetical protein
LHSFKLNLQQVFEYPPFFHFLFIENLVVANNLMELGCKWKFFSQPLQSFVILAIDTNISIAHPKNVSFGDIGFP